MTKQKSTKRALLFSALSLLMCVSMLIGSTFAWFTDSVTSGLNKIQSGTLDIKLEHSYGYYDGPVEEVTATTELFKHNVDGEAILWEPGVSMVEYFTITNAGNLALKFDFKLVAANATATAEGKTLLDVLRVQAMQSSTTAEHLKSLNSTLLPDPTVHTSYELKDFGYDNYLLPGENVVFAVHVMWEPTNNDNDYNVPGGLSLDLGVTLIATQYTYEKDSMDDQYDKDAVCPTVVSTVADMVEVCKTGGQMVLGNDITYTAENTEMMIKGSIFLLNGKNVTLDLNGHSFTVAEDAKQVYGAVFFVGNPGGHIDIVGDGEITVKNGLAATVWTLQTGTANIYGGTYTSNSVSNEAMIYSQGNGGVINVYGGKYIYDLDRHLNGGFNVSDWAGSTLRIIIHEGVMLSRPEYSQHLQGVTNGEQSRIQLAEGCTVEEVVIDGETWYQVVKA